MRVVQIIDNLSWGGAQKMLSMLARELIARQIDVVAVSLDADDIHAPYSQILHDIGINVMLVPGRRLFDLKRIYGLIRLIRQGGFDVVHTHLSYANMLGVLAGRLAGLPVVITLHSTGVDRRYYHPIRYKLETMALRCIGCSVVAVGHAVAKAQQNRIGTKKNIIVIPNAMMIFPDLPLLERQNLRQSLTGKTDGSVLISVGRLSPDKGYADMIAAFAIVLLSHPDASLVIVGDGILDNELKEQAHSLGVGRNVFFLGARDDVPLLLKSSDMYISASYREGMSMSLLEAMAAGLPIVATDVGDAPKMFTESSGILIKPGSPNDLAETINSLLADPSRMNRMGRAAVERVTHEYGLDAWANSYKSLYQSLVRSL